MEVIVLILLIATVVFYVQLQKSVRKSKFLAFDLSQLQKKYDEIYEKYKSITDVEDRINSLKIENLELEKSNYEYKEINKLFHDQADSLIIYGFYENKYEFENSEIYKNELLKIRTIQKEFINNGKAVYSKIKWSLGDSKKDGEKVTKNIIKLILMAFNGECDSIITDVKFSNITRYIEKIKKIRDSINKLVEYWGCEISQEYYELKISELKLMYEYKEKLEREKEEQRLIKEQIKEEEKAIREAEKAKIDAIKAEQKYKEEIEKAKLGLVTLGGAELNKMKSYIEELESKLIEAERAKERAISMAQLTKCGFVYIISNIGSFGENVYKIGMTRRQEPMDRVKELGDASVPFEFDVHALIYSENAPELENYLHRQFENKRVNRVNLKKEFFHVSLKDISNVIREKGLKFELTMLATAKEYRETIAINQLNEMKNAS